MLQFIHSTLLLSLYNIFFSAEKPTRFTKPSEQILVSTLDKKKVTVFIADDDEDDRDIFMEVITDVVPHADVTVAKNGIELMGLLSAATAIPDVIFLDLNMPLMNGQECLDKIRANGKLKNIPIIIYSTSNSREHIDETFKKGATFYFPKPTSFKDLKQMISKLFKLNWSGFKQPDKDKFILSVNHFH